MGLFKKIKEKIFGKSVAQSEKYVVGLEKSRKNFQDKFKELVARYRDVDESYFDECFIALEFKDNNSATKAYKNLKGKAVEEVKYYPSIYVVYKNLILLDMYVSYYITNDYNLNEKKFGITNDGKVLLSTLSLPTTFYIPDGIEQIAGFSMKLSGVKKVVCNEELVEIGMFAFSYDVEEVVLNENLKTISFGAFSECENLKTVRK